MKAIDNIRLLGTLAVRNVGRNPRRSFLTLSAVAVGLWSALGIAAIARGMSTQMTLDAINNLTGHIKIQKPAYLSDPVIEHTFSPPSAQLLAQLNSDSVKNWTARVRVPGVVMSERESAGVTIVGIDPGQEMHMSFIGTAITHGEFLKDVDDSGIIIGEKLASLLHTAIGKRVVLMSEGRDHRIADRGFRVVGIFQAELQATEKAFVFIGRAVAQQMLGLGNDISEISLYTRDRNKLDPPLSALASENPELAVATWMNLEPLIVAIVSIQDGFLKIWAVIVLITIAFGLINTLFMAIFERIREFGLFHALGMKPSWVIIQIMLESIVLLFLGGLAGNILGYGTVVLLSQGIDLSEFARGTEQFRVSSVIYPVLLTKDWLWANTIILCAAAMSSLIPAWRASRYGVTEALSR